ncbi:arylamine N-acetyltransferase, pineal gland isozyme NAT-3 [Podospora fimiseda]|uniref:Arylamine N-acetyltransferase, pineal gland isozyme NAT-3 n=1 Tax=Podospora fimiseda TaxID=252190 RepID=A0AAN6YNJ6_9PEZI|nr:arylamine N-acetyltransferase, pineal gland isozyme NAT-3 [Podospora fimiseda]
MAIWSDHDIRMYLKRIDYPASLEDLKTLISSDPLEGLKSLQKFHLVRVPFESVSLHYSPHRTLSLDPVDLYEKIVSQGRGGYCMEVNAFFACVLRSLGYNLINVGGRVKGPDGYKGWDHMLNLVKINNKRYVVDVGFGSNGPLFPYPLEHDHEFVGIASARGRLQYRTVDQLTDPDQKVWVYSIKQNDETPWSEAYCFVELEFMPGDFEVMNLRTMTSPRSFFVQNVMCMRILLDGRELDAKPIGKLILHRDFVKKIVGDETEEVQKLESEAQRVLALEKYFGIRLSQREEKAIKGLASELKDTSKHA